jgi:outer membrane receptor protein involved in Fe transport
VGSVLNGLPTVNNPETPLPSYTIGNISVALNHRPYQLIAYVDNVADKRAVLGYNNLPNPPVVGTISAFDVINRPREIGVRINYTF